MTDQTSPRHRTPAGVPTGGQFAASSHAESGVALDARPADAETEPVDPRSLAPGDTVRAGTGLARITGPSTAWVDPDGLAGVTYPATLLPSGQEIAVSYLDDTTVERALIPGPVSHYADDSPRPYALLDKPQTTALPSLTTVTNHTAAPISHDDGIFAYGGHVSLVPADRPGTAYRDIPGIGFRFTGGVSARDGQDLQRHVGWARSNAEGWDRHGAIDSRWADIYDRRTSLARGPNDDETRQAMARRDVECAARIATADHLTAAIEDRRALPALPVLPSKRRAARRAEAAVTAAWADYQKAYPDWARGRDQA